jgi:hypothetical protein
VPFFRSKKEQCADSFSDSCRRLGYPKKTRSCGEISASALTPTPFAPAKEKEAFFRSLGVQILNALAEAVGVEIDDLADHFLVGDLSFLGFFFKELNAFPAQGDRDFDLLLL